MRRIRLGEALMGIGAIALFALLFADWFHGGGISGSGWSSLGWALDALLVVAIGLAPDNGGPDGRRRQAGDRARPRRCSPWC